MVDFIASGCWTGLAFLGQTLVGPDDLCFLCVVGFSLLVICENVHIYDEVGY
jgi:hypothetical protein